MSQGFTTPTELARRLGVTPLQLRNWLRATFPRPDAEKYQRWHLDEKMVRAATSWFASLR